MDATANAEAAYETAGRALQLDDPEQINMRVAIAQVRALAAIAGAIDRLAAAVENLGERGISGS